MALDADLIGTRANSVEFLCFCESSPTSNLLGSVPFSPQKVVPSEKKVHFGKHCQETLS